jgi:hypothetical protein
MKVILDTNILFNNYFLNSNKFEALFAYLKKANSDLLIFDYVLEELKKNYRKEVEKYLSTVERNERVLFNKKYESNIESKVEEYVNFLSQIQIRERIIFPKSKSVDSKEIFRRAIEEKLPFQQSGNGFKDTLIWMSIIHTVKSNKNDYYAFITANSRDFGVGKLAPELLDDLGVDSDRLIYFNSLEDFLSEYGKKIDFITDEFISTYLNKLSEDYIINLVGEEKLQEYRGFPPSQEIDSIKQVELTQLELHNYFIYYANEDYYKVQAEIVLSFQLEATVFDRIERRTSFGSVTVPVTCLVDVPLLINKKTHTIEIDKSEKIDVLHLS